MSGGNLRDDMRQSSKFSHHEPCDCGSSDGRAVYEDGSKYCFVCKTFWRSNDAREEEKEERMGHRIDELSSAALESRGISREVAEEYGVLVEYDEATREESAYYFPRTKNGQVTGYQVRYLPKDFRSIGDTKNCELFGQSHMGDGGKFIIVCEGNEDTLAARQMLLSLGKNYRVVGLPNGANIQSIRNNLEWLERYECVVFALDQDKPGRECAQEAAELLSPGRSRIAKWDEDVDINDFLMQGRAPDFLNVIRRASEVRPDGIVGVMDIYQQAISPTPKGKDWPWPRLTELTHGRRRREIYLMGGGTGAGKTEVLKELAHHIMEVDRLPVGLIFLEEHPALTAKMLAGKKANKRFHLADGDYTQEELEEGIRDLDGRVFFYNHEGRKDWHTIKAKIRYLVAGLGIKDIFLDHITGVVAGENDVNKFLEKTMPEIAGLVEELEFTLYLVSHLNTPEGKAHEEGGRVTIPNFRGSRALAFWCHYILGFERNQQAEDETEKQTLTIRVLKARHDGSKTGHVVRVRFNPESGRLVEEDALEF